MLPTIGKSSLLFSFMSFVVSIGMGRRDLPHVAKNRSDALSNSFFIGQSVQQKSSRRPSICGCWQEGIDNHTIRCPPFRSNRGGFFLNNH